MKREKLQNLLDSLDEGPLGKSQLYWDRVQRALAMSSNPDIVKKRGLKISKAIGGKKRGPSKRRKPINAFEVIKANANKNSPIVGKTFLKRYESAYDAADDLKLRQSDIAVVLSPNNTCISVKGYSFEYA